tara:strand:+ start:176 stop:739 length:564 start_codon:yes stop_codon:yes gene_type:complete
MSKIALTPNASGSGTFTIAAPNSNTDRSLTLPDEAGTVLTSASSVTQNSGPAFSAYATATQSISNGAFTKIIFNAEEYDTDGAFDSSTNYRFQPNVQGYYHLSVNLTNADDSSAYRKIIEFYKNGSVYLRANDMKVILERMSASLDIHLNGSSDYVEAFYYQENTSNISSTTKSLSSWFSGHLIRKA